MQRILQNQAVTCRQLVVSSILLSPEMAEQPFGKARGSALTAFSYQDNTWAPNTTAFPKDTLPTLSSPRHR